jgi:hypothetical protein
MEQNKTAEEILREHVEQESIRRGDGTISDEDWAYGDEDGVMQIAINAMEEYASQQTASLRERVKELEGENGKLRDKIEQAFDEGIAVYSAVIDNDAVPNNRLLKKLRAESLKALTEPKK